MSLLDKRLIAYASECDAIDLSLTEPEAVIEVRSMLAEQVERYTRLADNLERTVAYADRESLGVAEIGRLGKCARAAKEWLSAAKEDASMATDAMIIAAIIVARENAALNLAGGLV